MSRGIITGEDCGYSHAVDVLVNLGDSMGQETPPAMLTPKIPMVLTARNTPVCSETEGDETESESSQSPQKQARGVKRARCAEGDAPSPKRIRIDPWDDMMIKEGSAVYKVQRNYPDSRWREIKMPPGSRRKAVNLIHLMASALNLEVGTPGTAVLMFDRFMSAVSVPVPSNKVLFIAAVCLNIAGKIFDIDKGYCGSKEVMRLIRCVSHESIIRKTERAFAAFMTDMEYYILKVLDFRTMEIPTALQCIAAVTTWERDNGQAWLHAALLCDILSTDTASTNFSQWEIARAVIHDICGIPSGEGTMHVTEALKRSKRIFVASGGEQPHSDPYFGTRMRHSLNSAIPLLAED